MLSPGFGYGRDVARRDVDLPPTPTSFTIVDDREDEECGHEVEGEVALVWHMTATENEKET